MKTWGSLGNWIIASILRPVLGTWWAEITALIVCVLIIAFVIIFVIICKKYLTTIKVYESSIKINADLRNEISKKDATIKAHEFNLDKMKEEITNLKNNIAIKEVELATLSEKSKTDVVKSDNIDTSEEMKKTKRSESAKKAAETRKKNKESQKTIEKLVDKE